MWVSRPGLGLETDQRHFFEVLVLVLASLVLVSACLVLVLVAWSWSQRVVLSKMVMCLLSATNTCNVCKCNKLKKHRYVICLTSLRQLAL